MTTERRQEIYSTMFRFMIDNEITESIPLSIGPLCEKLGIKLVTLSQITAATGLMDNDVFDIWGNEDGVMQRYKRNYKISYNDHAQPGRVRFTLCEELSHVILGHTKDKEFDIFNQKYSSTKYDRYEEEARIGAGILLCNPRFFYYYQRILSPIDLADICCITLQCAKTRYGILKRCESEITSNKVYPFLPLPEFDVSSALHHSINRIAI